MMAVYMEKKHGCVNIYRMKDLATREMGDWTR